MPVKTTYYSDEEMAAIEELADEEGETFSGIVRTAIQEYYDI